VGGGSVVVEAEVFGVSWREDVLIWRTIMCWRRHLPPAREAGVKSRHFVGIFVGIPVAKPNRPENPDTLSA
jgi:hypothetical protein